MTSAELDAAEALAATATPGPWHAQIMACDDSLTGEICSEGAATDNHWPIVAQPADDEELPERDKNARFIAASRTLVPSLVAAVRERDATIREIVEPQFFAGLKLHIENEKLRETLRALIAALPKCDYCDRPATRSYGRNQIRWCDEHGPGVTEYPRAAPLRAAIEALGSR